MRLLAELFWVFCRIGLFSIGGGYVMLPLMRRDMVEKRGWVTDEELLNYYAIGQAVPGIIAINTATFVGYRRAGVAGAIAATCGMVTPSLIIILFIAMSFAALHESAVMQRAFRGIRVAVAVVLGFTLVDLARKSVRDGLSLALAGGALAAVVLAGLSPVPVILAAVLIGLLRSRMGKGRA